MAQRTKHLDANNGKDVVARVLVSNDMGRCISFFHNGYKATLEIPPRCAFMMSPFLGCGAGRDIHHGGSYELSGMMHEQDHGQQHGGLACVASPGRTQFKFTGSSGTKAAGVALAIDIHVKQGLEESGWDVFDGFPKNSHDFVFVNAPQLSLAQHAAKLVNRGLLNDHQRVVDRSVNFYGDRCYREYQRSSGLCEQGLTKTQLESKERGLRKRARESAMKTIARKVRRGLIIPTIMCSVPHPSGSGVASWVMVMLKGNRTEIHIIYRLFETCVRALRILVIEVEKGRVVNRTSRVVVLEKAAPHARESLQNQVSAWW